MDMDHIWHVNSEHLPQSFRIASLLPDLASWFIAIGGLLFGDVSPAGLIGDCQPDYYHKICPRGDKKDLGDLGCQFRELISV